MFNIGRYSTDVFIRDTLIFASESLLLFFVINERFWFIYKFYTILLLNVTWKNKRLPRRSKLQLNEIRSVENQIFSKDINNL